MAEPADAPDLGSGGRTPWEFESPSSHSQEGPVPCTTMTGMNR